MAKYEIKSGDAFNVLSPIKVFPSREEFISSDVVAAYVLNGAVGEVVGTNRNPRIRYIAQKGDLAIGTTPKRIQVLSHNTHLQFVNLEALNTPSGNDLIRLRNQTRFRQLDELDLQEFPFERVAFAINTLMDESGEISIRQKHIGQWIGMTQQLISREITNLKTRGILKADKTQTIKVIDQEELVKLINTERPLKI